MSALREVGDASLGWLDLLAGRPDAMAKFNVSRIGWRNAGLFYGVVVLLNIATYIVILGRVDPLGALVQIVPYALPLASLYLVCATTARLLRQDVMGLLVTGTYALAFLLLVSLPLTLVVGPELAAPMLGLIAYFLYRSARVAGGLSIGLSIVYAVLTPVVLVLVSIGLYMLLTPNGG